MSEVSPSVPKKCRKHNWEWLGETTQSTYEWCSVCGCVKRTTDGGRVYILVPESLKHVATN